MLENSDVKCIELDEKYVEKWHKTKEITESNKISPAVEQFIVLLLLFLPIQLIFLLIFFIF
jgi:hypothetical protein